MSRIQLSKNFYEDEFTCFHGRVDMAIELIDKLQELRDRFGKPIGIIKNGGGFRCSECSGSKISTHKDGAAADLEYKITDHFELLRLAFKVGFKGIGDKNSKGRFQMHVDVFGGNRRVIRPAKWTYK